MKTLIIIAAVLLVLACPAIGLAALAAELGVCGGLVAMIVRVLRRPAYAPRRAG